MSQQVSDRAVWGRHPRRVRAEGKRTGKSHVLVAVGVAAVEAGHPGPLPMRVRGQSHLCERGELHTALRTGRTLSPRYEVFSPTDLGPFQWRLGEDCQDQAALLRS